MVADRMAAKELDVTVFGVRGRLIQRYRHFKQALSLQLPGSRPESALQPVTQAPQRQADLPSLAWPPGHFYSPIPSIPEVRAREARIFSVPSDLPGIPLYPQEQLKLLEHFETYLSDLPYGSQTETPQRYTLDNPNFNFCEAAILYAFIRYLRPNRIVEIGSGYSSCVILDASESVIGQTTQCTFIDPFPELLRSLLRPGDESRIQIVSEQVQHVDSRVFGELQEGDILFIDSSHVAKTGSDVVDELFRILPRLKQGVYIHWHDVLYPFEYQPSWVYGGRAWNEAYALHAFLMYNERFRIRLWMSYLAQFEPEQLARILPGCLESPGSNLWVQSG